MKRIICDIETDGLNPSKVWVIVCIDVDTEKVDVFVRPDLDKEPFLEYTRRIDCWIGHNFISYDYFKVIRKFFQEAKIDPRKIIDTLVCSRTFRFDVEGGHSLEAWSKRLGFTKPFIEDWDQGATEEIISRCIEDVKGNLKLFKFFEKHIYHDVFSKALRLEHDTVLICEDISHNGFAFDEPNARKMLGEIDERLSQLDAEIAESFPPEFVTEEFIPKVNSTKYGYVKGEVFKRVTEVPFNPASPRQIVSKLNQAGWKPVNKTKGHIKAERDLKNCRAKKDSPERVALSTRLSEFAEIGWSVDEENLSTLPSSAPSGARKLAERITLASRRSSLIEWLGQYNASTGAIHGTFQHIGSWTHRKSHQRPNMANIPSNPDVKDRDNPTPVEALKLKYNMPMRALWVSRPKRRLIGVDADGIQLRILAHYMRDKDFIEALVSGKKEDRTDPHSLNALKLGIGYDHRDRAKKFIYAWLLGAGNDKVAELLQYSKKQAVLAQESFIEGYPGLKRLRYEDIPEIALKGYFEGIDGRYVPVPNEHKVLAGLLQNGESIVMKQAAVIWRTEARRLKIPFWQVNDVHDEWQTETEDNDEVANLLERIQCDSIRQAGEMFKLNCPLLGTGGNQGYSWAETH